MLSLALPTLVSTALLSLAAHQEPLPRALVKATAGPVEVVVLDDTTGAPISSARTLALNERLAPLWGETWRAAEAPTNTAGIALLPAAKEPGEYDWIMVQAVGYGTAGTSGKGTEGTVEFRLKPETPITIEVVDFLGRPLPLAHLGVAFG